MAHLVGHEVQAAPHPLAGHHLGVVVHPSDRAARGPTRALAQDLAVIGDVQRASGRPHAERDGRADERLLQRTLNKGGILVV